LEHRQRLTATGEFAARRRQQRVKWMWSMPEQRVVARLHADRSLKAKLKQIESAVADGRLSPALAVERTAGLLGL
jgi:LAO/AO transport system kinase